MAEKVITAAIALVKVTDPDGVLVEVGRMRNLRITENVRRGRVVGIGEITPSEIPALEWTGTVNVGQFAFKAKTSVMSALSRDFTSTAQFVQNLLFDVGVDISLLKKIKKEDGTYENITFAHVMGCLMTSEGLDISEGQIGGRDGTFEYTTPIVYG